VTLSSPTSPPKPNGVRRTACVKRWTPSGPFWGLLRQRS
jgi:hypothetical protein